MSLNRVMRHDLLNLCSTSSNWPTTFELSLPRCNLNLLSYSIKKMEKCLRSCFTTLVLSVGRDSELTNHPSSLKWCWARPTRFKEFLSSIGNDFCPLSPDLFVISKHNVSLIENIEQVTVSQQHRQKYQKYSENIHKVKSLDDHR